MRTSTTRRRAMVGLTVVAATAAIGLGAGTGTALANTGVDCAVTTPGPIYSDDSTASTVVGELHTTQTWHHYYSVTADSGTRWSSGYVSGSSTQPGGVVRGYVPYARLSC